VIDLHHGRAEDVLPTLEAGSFDAVVTDPPAGISFMGQEWDVFGSRRNSHAKEDRAAARRGPGAGGNQPFAYSGSGLPRSGERYRFVAALTPIFAECLRVAKPGAHALVWALPRTSHWTATALEDAGWQVEDRLAHIFGTGFPKHKSKLKPAVEDWWLCTKPGGAKWLNVDACRVASPGGLTSGGRPVGSSPCPMNRAVGLRDDRERSIEHSAGRWPPNLLLSHAPACNGTCAPGCPVAELDRQGGERKSGGRAGQVYKTNAKPGFGWGNIGRGGSSRSISDSGGASRFFPTFAWSEADDLTPFLYCPKASRADRGEGNTHPTVKPLALMRWLCRLACPPGGRVLDPFAGSGTTLLAADAEGFDAVGVEQDPVYCEMARRRIAAARESAPLLSALP
jgi:DNA modification methylase